jgi:hypothetical protein
MESTGTTLTGQTQATVMAVMVAESVENSLGSGPTTNQPEGAISGLSNLKRKCTKLIKRENCLKLNTPN